MSENIFIMGRGIGKTLIMSIAQGNPGALQFCCELVKECEPKGLDYVNTLGMIDLKGPRAYQLWNDCCHRDTKMAAGILQAYIDGKITQEEIHEHTDKPWGIPFDMEEIMAREPKKPGQGFLKARHGMMMLGKTPEGTCPECAVAHDPALPHNQQSMAYQYHFYDQHGRWPTWADAMAHCSEEMKEQWKAGLKERGIEVE